MTSFARNPIVAGAIGGLIVLIAAAIAVATGLVGDDGEQKVVQAPIASTVNDDGRSGLTVREIYDRDAPGVVFIQGEVVRREQSPFGLPQEQRGQASGSGFVIDDSGHVLTNAHVVDSARNIQVGFSDDETADAKLIGSDPSSDVALLKVKTDAKNLHPLSFGDSSKLHVGDPVVAIGNPFGLDQTVTTGIVSALQRQLRAPNDFTINDVIQTDAAINPGNSGGPLLDGRGRVVGINSQIATAGSGGNIGIGFAVPINTVKKISEQLKDDGRVEHAFLGITGADVSSRIADRLNLAIKKGVLVQEVSGPAKKAGIEGGDTEVTILGQQLQLGGDVITKVDGKPVSTMEDVIKVVDSKKPGDSVTVTILRSGKEKQIKVKLGSRPADASTTTTTVPEPDDQTPPGIPGLP
jgi:S1-C subfamily serine protease